MYESFMYRHAVEYLSATVRSDKNVLSSTAVPFRSLGQEAGMA